MIVFHCPTITEGLVYLFMLSTFSCLWVGIGFLLVMIYFCHLGANKEDCHSYKGFCQEKRPKFPYCMIYLFIFDRCKQQVLAHQKNIVRVQKNFCFHFDLQPNLVKSCCGLWPVHLPHKFEEKEKKEPLVGMGKQLTQYVGSD